MAGSIKIGSLFGIPVLLHWSFLVAIPLFAAIIGIDIAISSSFVFDVLGIPPSFRDNSSLIGIKKVCLSTFEAR